MIFDFASYKNQNYKTEILSGLTVALALLPEVVAFAFVAGVPPLAGLYSAFFICLITALFGGRPGMISGAAGAIAVVVVALVKTHGIEYLFAAVILMGLIQILFGVLKLGQYIRLVPQAVIYGFVNGLAIVIAFAQLGHLKTLDTAGVETWMSGAPLWSMIGLIALTMTAIFIIPKLTKKIPASLTSVLIVSAAVIGFGLQTKTVGDLASIKGGLPLPHIPMVPFTWATFVIVWPYSLIMAGVGLIETLLTLTLVDDMTDTRGQPNKESIAQGCANIVTGFFGGMGGCAMIGQTMVNMGSGGRSRISGIAGALALLSFIVFGSTLIEKIPVASLVGLMFMVSIATFEWTSFKLLKKIPKADAFVLILVSILTVVFNLAIAVITGVICAALVFSWQSAVRIRARKYIDESGTKHYEIWGPLFFGSVANFHEKFDPVDDPSEVIIDFKDSRVADHSGIEALEKVTEKYAKLGKRVRLRHLSSDCRAMLGRAGALVETNFEEDPSYTVMESRS